MTRFHSPSDPAFTTVEALRAHVIAGLHDALKGAEITPAQEDPNRLLVHRSGAQPGVVHLGNLATELVGQLPRPEAEARIRDFIHMVKKLAAGTPEIAAERLYPGLRHRDFPLNSGAAPMTRPAPGDCVAVLISDEGAHTAMVTDEMLQAAGIDPDDAWDAAEENFAEALTGLALYQSDQGLMSLEIDGFEWLGSSLMLAPVVIAHVMQAQETGPVYLAAPSRQSVDFVAASGADSLAVLEHWMSIRLSEPHPQSDMVYRFAPGDAQPRPAFVFNDGRLHALS
ncbi:hypothetical protein [Tropicibacter oceani]|uniref:Uncharacterized protein n=1 Tax=Tropicibacter oceani TaxID=3058420 RepID=A0ABY8QCF4_9RHOB|nr:hypothetical protein [Tropicibacter oceani]WGW02235.1 hypothetical protein QF118_09695 [Tropicibacter oceani]